MQQSKYFSRLELVLVSISLTLVITTFIIIVTGIKKIKCVFRLHECPTFPFWICSFSSYDAIWSEKKRNLILVPVMLFLRTSQRLYGHILCQLLHQHFFRFCHFHISGFNGSQTRTANWRSCQRRYVRNTDLSSIE